jgi:nicotinamidase-related amidase
MEALPSPISPTEPKTMTTPYVASRTALLVVDPYNDFMTEGGKLYEAIKPTADASGLFDNLRKIIPAARASAIQIFVLPHHRSHEGDFDGWQNMTPFQKQGDVVVHEHWAQSGFANTDLDAQLKQHGINNVILVGVIANSCIESTGRFAMELGYNVTLVRDAAAAFSHEGMHAAFEVNGPMYAHAILTTAELLALFPA